MEKTISSQQQSKNYVLPIIIMFALFFMIAFVTGYQNPLGSVIKKMTGGNAILTQLGTLANFIAYAFMGLPAGMMLQKKGYRITSLGAVSVGFIGVLITYMSQFIGDVNTSVVIYLIGAFVSGFSMCMLNTVVNPMLNSLGKNENQGNQLVQFGGACNSLGATLAPMVVGALMGQNATSIADGNAVFYMAMGIFAAAFLVIYFSKLPESPTLGQKTEEVKVSGAFKYRNFVLGVVAIFCYVGVEVGIANFSLQYVENYLKENPETVSTAAATAGAVSGVYWLLMLVGRLIGGAVGGKVSSRAMLAFVAIVGLVFLALAINLPESITVDMFGIDKENGFEITTVVLPISVLFLILCGLCTSVMWGAIFNLSVSGLGKYTQVASGIFMVMVCGGGIWPFIQSLIVGDGGLSSYLSSFWLVFALVAYQLFYALVGSRVKKA